MDATLRTDRLLLRPWRETDAQALFRYACLPEVADPAGWRPHRDVAESARTIREFYAGRGFALTFPGEDVPFGNLGLYNTFICRAVKSMVCREIGFSMAPEQWNKGLMTEAVRAVIDYAFAQTEIECLWMAYFEDNERTARIARKLGFRHSFDRDGEAFTVLFKPS